MGGAGGHMSHPYDLDEVKNGADLIKILMGIPKHLAMDAVNATIKLDGSNNSVKVIDRRGKLEFALDRGAMGLGKGELDYQGLTPDDYEARGLNVGLQSSTNILLGILNDALETANIEPELYALGLIDKEGKADYSKFLNTEFYDKDNPNSIAYDIGNFIAFHGVYQFYEKFHRRGTPDKPNPGAQQVRGGLPRPTYVDRKDDKEKYKKVTSKRVPYDPKALASLVKKVRPFAKKAGFEMVGPAAAKQKDTKMVKETIADMKASLAKPITIQISKDRAETKSLEEWLRESANPLTTKYELPDGSQVYLGCQNCIRLSSGVKTNPYNKEKIYKPIMINKEPIVDYFENSDGQVNAMAALNSAILFHATRLLGQDIKNHLTTDIFGDVTDHEGAVVRNYGSEDFKITGEFMMDETGGFAQKRVPTVNKDEFLQEEEESIDLDVIEDEFAGRRPPQTIALVPGAFKPPHKGHADMVRRYATGDGVQKADKVYVIISAPEMATRKLRDGTEVTAQHALDAWMQLYPEVANLPEVEFEQGTREQASPVTIAYDYIGERTPLDLQAGDNIILGASKKDDDWKRWTGAEKYIRPDLNLLAGEEYAVDPYTRSDNEDLRASDLRDLISDVVENPDNTEAKSQLAEYVPADKINVLFSILGLPAPAAEEPLEEESGSGAAGGYTGPLGFTSAKPSRRKGKKKKSRKENLDLSMVDEIMALIMERGILQ